MDFDPSYRLAIDDGDFIRRGEMRAMRLALEYEKAELSLRDHSVESIVSVFGSARIRPSSEIREEMKALSSSDGDKMLRLESALKMSRYYNEAYEFSKIVAQRGGSLKSNSQKKFNVVASGAGPGIMEAVNKGAYDAGALSIGFGIELPFEAYNNAYVSRGVNFNFHYFMIRKFHLMQRPSAIVVFPGGFGSLDEFAEALTLRQTRKTHPFSIVLYGKAFWSNVINFNYLAESGMISHEDLSLFSYADTPEEAWNCLVKSGLFIPV